MNTSCGSRNTLLSIWFTAIILFFSVTFGSSRLLAAPIGINLATSSVTITHDPLPGVLAPHSVGGLGIVAPVMPLHVDAAGADFSAGAGATAPIVFPNVFGLLVAAGTGISQFDPAPNVPPSVLRIDYSIDYLFNAGGFPLPWFEFGNFPLISFAGPGDIVTFSATADFFSATLGVLIGPGVNLNFVNPGLGFVAANVGIINLAGAAIPAFDTVTMFGSIIFTADNQTGEASIFMSDNGGINVPEPTILGLLAIGCVALSTGT